VLSFTRHAMVFVREQLNLTEEELSELVEKDQCVLLGRDASKVHKLFYSILDEQWFIMVQNDVNGIVITILPLRHYNHQAVSETTLIFARDLVKGKAKHRKPRQVGNASPSVFRFNAGVVNLHGESRLVSLGTVPIQGHLTVEDAFADPFIRTILEERLARKLKPGDKIVSYNGSLGQRDLKVLLIVTPSCS
jgi:hypothetical protein